MTKDIKIGSTVTFETYEGVLTGVVSEINGKYLFATVGTNDEWEVEVSAILTIA